MDGGRGGVDTADRVRLGRAGAAPARGGGRAVYLALCRIDPRC